MMIDKGTRTILLLIIAILTLAYSGKVKPRTLFIEEEIGTARFAGEVVITGSDSKRNIEFKSTRFNDTISRACCTVYLKDAYHASYDLAGNHPDDNYMYVGDTVFIIVARDTSIKIFGRRLGNDYRLIYPFIPASTIFVFSEPLKGLDGASEWEKKNGSCMGGCLMPIDLTPGLVQEYRQKFKNKLDSIQLTRFINQPAWSVFYDPALKYYSHLTWTWDDHKKLANFTLTYSTGHSLEVYPVNKRDKSIAVDTTTMLNWDGEYGELKIKEIRWRD